MSTDAELSQLRVQLAEMQRERDHWQAENGRLRNELGQMHDKQVDLREKAGIIEQKYTASKVRAVEARRRIEAAECARARVIRLRYPFRDRRRTARCCGTFCRRACPSFGPSRKLAAALPSKSKARRASAILSSTRSLIRCASARLEVVF